MAYVHNVIIRGLNAIVQQGPYVEISSNPGYSQKDVEDFFFYVSSWVKMVNHHHWTEESFIFPEIEKFSGKPGLMNDPKHQHELFHSGLERLLAYTQATKPQSYRWDEPGGMKEIVDSFSKHLMDHLYAEVDMFLAMDKLDSAGLMKIWEYGEAIAKKASNFGMLVS